MAKGQKKSNREVRKPKKEQGKKLPVAAQSTKTAVKLDIAK